ncbi:hypothetical protein SDC9_200780 [bioreactor metagenome]|uniref:Uncharacterized protein n=1 Tax=bioreactor metagenome TaxID=1076179 RepID=A0A645IPW1_9ZZZZ
MDLKGSQLLVQQLSVKRHRNRHTGTEISHRGINDGDIGKA